MITSIKVNNRVMRVPKVHESKTSGLTDHANTWMFLTNAYMRKNPNSTLNEMGEYFIKKVGVRLSETSLRRYYYGVYHVNNSWRGPCYSRMRLGASVSI